MALISSAISSLVNGVSQQVYTQRLPSQAEAQVNFVSSLAKGLKRRPPSRHLARLTSADWTQAALHVINRDATERYVVAISTGDLKVFDLAGVEQTVAFPNGKDYLAAPNPAAAFRAVTVADYTFVLNRDVATAMATDLTPTRAAEALAHVRLGNYGRTYRIEIDGVQAASYTTPDGSAAAHANDIDTSAIATQLYNQLVAAGLTGFTFTRLQNAIHLQKSSGDFSIAVEDGFNGDALKVAKGQLQRFFDLPHLGPDGFHVEIVGDETTSFDNYYAAFDKDSSDSSDGVWREVAAQGVAYKVDAATMPHVLVRESDGTFTFRQADWTDRAVGDADSAPNPSFIGRKINDVFFFRNRLGMLSDESVVMSRAGDFFNFWPKTVTAQLDSDPIDVAGAHNRVSILHHAIPFNRSLLLFSDQTQFVLEGGDLLTPANASIKAITEFAASLAAKPVGAGRHVYFAIDKGGFAGVREFFTERLADVSDAADITKHVPTLIPERVSKIAVAENDDMMALLTTGAPHQIFTYSFYWSGDQKLQSAWSVWSFDPTDRILSADFIDSRLVMVVGRSDGAYLEEVDLDLGAVETGSTLLFHMDRKITEAACAVSTETISGETWTRFGLPYAESADLWVVARADSAEGASPEGRVLAYERVDASAIRLLGDQTAAKLAIGRKYLSRYVFSPFIVRQQAAGPGAGDALGDGRLQVLYVSVLYEDAGDFRLVVTPRAGDVYSYTMTGRVAGADANVLGAPALETGRFKAPVYARNTDVQIAVETDSAFGSAFQSAEWEGRLNLRSQRR